MPTWGAKSASSVLEVRFGDIGYDWVSTKAALQARRRSRLFTSAAAAQFPVATNGVTRGVMEDSFAESPGTGSAPALRLD